MSRVLTRDLQPGMVTAEDVYSTNEQLIISQGQRLTENYINRLVFYSIGSVRIRDDVDDYNEAPVEEEKLVKPLHSEPTNTEKILASPEYHEFKASFDDTVETMKKYMNDIVGKRTQISEEFLLHQIEDLILHSDNGVYLFDMLHHMHCYDDPTYAHCINVALIAHIFAKWLGFEQDEVDTVTLAGLLHDIGKTQIPDSIITKPGKLTDEEFEVIKIHPIEGYRILKDSSLNPHIINSAYMHHERMDGSGYPMGLVGEQIDPCARIIAIADVYDAMTSRRVYRDAMCPFKVISIFESGGYQKYDSQFIYVFLEYIVNTFINNRVRLSDGRVGSIALINKHDLAHPVVNCGNEWVDLSRDHSISIEEIL